LQKQGFKLKPINEKIKGVEITTKWMVIKHRRALTFHLNNGIFVADISNVKRYIASFNDENIIAISTRNNPFGVPNDTMKSRTLKENLDIINNDNSMDVVTDNNEMQFDDLTHKIDNNSDELSRINDINNNIDINDNSDHVIDLSKNQDVQSDNRQNIELSDQLINDDHIINDNANIENESEISNGSEASVKDGPDYESRTQHLHPNARGDPKYCPSLGRRLTKHEEHKMTLMHQLHIATGHAGRLTEKRFVSHLLNSELTVKDVDIYYELFPTCQACLKGKMAMPAQTAFKPPT
jgi:hypothetical protein